MLMSHTGYPFGFVLPRGRANDSVWLRIACFALLPLLLFTRVGSAEDSSRTVPDIGRSVYETLLNQKDRFSDSLRNAAVVRDWPEDAKAIETLCRKCVPTTTPSGTEPSMRLVGSTQPSSGLVHLKNDVVLDIPTMKINLPRDILNVQIGVTWEKGPFTVRADGDAGAALTWNIPVKTDGRPTPVGDLRADQTFKLWLTPGDVALDVPETATHVSFRLDSAPAPTPATKHPFLCAVVRTLAVQWYFMWDSTDSPIADVLDRRKWNVKHPGTSVASSVVRGLMAGAVNEAAARAVVADEMQDLLQLTDEKLLLEVLAADKDALRKTNSLKTATRTGLIFRLYDSSAATDGLICRLHVDEMTIYIIEQPRDRKNLVHFAVESFDEAGGSLWCGQITIDERLTDRSQLPRQMQEMLSKATKR